MTRFGRYIEGHYTIKRVIKLPKKGNTNWLYAIRGPILDKLYRWDIEDKEYEIIILGSEQFIPENTVLTFNDTTNELSITFVDGSIKTTILDIKGVITTYTDSTDTLKNKIGEYLNEDNTTVDVFETNTDVRLENNTVIYTREDGSETSIDLTFLVNPTIDVQVISASWNEVLSTIVLTKNNGDTISIILTGLTDSKSIITNNLIIGNTIATHSDGDGVSIDIKESITSLELLGDNLTYTKENNSQDIIDLSSLTGGGTNLGYITDPEQGIVTSSTGTDVVLPPANNLIAGLQKANFYREGTLNIEMRAHATLTNITYTYDQVGTYIRVGNSVTFKFTLSNINSQATAPIHYLNNRTRVDITLIEDNITLDSTTTNPDSATLGFLSGVQNIDFYSATFSSVPTVSASSICIQDTLGGSMIPAPIAFEFVSGRLHVQGSAITTIYTP